MTLTFAVDDMHCQSCAKRVSDAVRTVAPAAEVKVDVPAGRVTVDGAGDPAPILRAIADAGYEARVAA